MQLMIPFPFAVYSLDHLIRVGLPKSNIERMLEPSYVLLSSIQYRWNCASSLFALPSAVSYLLLNRFKSILKTGVGMNLCLMGGVKTRPMFCPSTSQHKDFFVGENEQVNECIRMRCIDFIAWTNAYR
jgi:hypothetical protein